MFAIFEGGIHFVLIFECLDSMKMTSSEIEVALFVQVQPMKILNSKKWFVGGNGFYFVKKMGQIGFLEP